MNMSGTTTVSEKDALPFVAPCRRVPASAPIAWIKLGWQDMRRAPVPSLSIGVTIAALSMLLSFIGIRVGGYWVEIIMLSGFVFVAPVLGVGLYATSRELERGNVPGFGVTTREIRRDFSTLMVFALVLLVVFLVWARAATMIHVFMPNHGTPTLKELAPFLLIGTGVGAVFCVITFAAVAFSLPMIVERDVDAVTAVLTSVCAVMRNKSAMLVWSLCIVVALFIGFATLMIGLTLLMPVIGHASWHGYRAVIDANGYPEHPQQ